VSPVPDRTALVFAPALLLLVSACGGSTKATTPSTGSQTMLAFSSCVREHGVRNFPDPDSSGQLPASGKQIAAGSPRFPAAENACMHLLSSGAETQGDQQKIAFALKVAQCVRSYGFPTYPDPTTSGPSSQGSGTRFHGTGIDTKSRRFQTAEINCEKQTRKALVP
jgi:hypothetical protein